MYTTVESARRWNSLAPLILILLLGLVLFAVAATIVISLIALYLPTRSVNVVSTTSGAQQLTIPLSSGSNIAIGSLDDTVQTSLQNQMQTAVSANNEAQNRASVLVTDAVGINTGKRKRRQANETANAVIVTFELLFTGRCPMAKCRAKVLALIRALFTTLHITLTVSVSNTTTSSTGDEVTGNIDLISQYWGNLRPYQDNPDNYFGVLDTGLPDGCQIEQAFVVHRHAARYPSPGDTAGINNVTSYLKNTTGNYTGLLSFFNTWTNQLGTDLLVPEGTSMEYQSGVNFWAKYGRLLYNAAPGQNYYNATGETIPQLRCNTIPRITDSAVSWANGFFALYNTTAKYTLLAMPAALGVNNTLASYYSCVNFLNTSYAIYNLAAALYYPIDNYLKDTVTRLSQYVPSDITLSAFDVFILQSLCPYEYGVFGSSDFCNLFTLNEWRGFRYAYDLYLYNGYSFGSPFGRALGLGILEELVARLTNQTIPISDSSVNTTFDGSTSSFPLGQLFYLDMTHDFMLVGLLTALSLDYFRQDLLPNAFPPPEDRHFKTTNIIPYAARIITEKIGCVSSNPTATNSNRTQYTPTQYGYSAENAVYKFIRMRLNSGILPLETIRGGYCVGRTDGLCSLDNFLASQANASAEANYGELCFGNFVYNASQFTGDGNYFPK